MKKDKTIKFRVTEDQLNRYTWASQYEGGNLTQYLINAAESFYEMIDGEVKAGNPEFVPTKNKSVPTKQAEKVDIVPTNVPTNKVESKNVPTKPNEANTAPSWLAKLKESQEKQKARKKA